MARAIGHERTHANVASLKMYKKGQGKYTRSLTFVGVMLIGVIAAVLTSRWLQTYAPPYVRFGAPTAFVALLGLLMVYLLNKPSVADFLIATEAEMKKVSWSSRKEIVGATKVVIVTTFILAAILFGVDVLFSVVFHWAGISGG